MAILPLLAGNDMPETPMRMKAGAFVTLAIECDEIQRGIESATRSNAQLWSMVRAKETL